MNNANPLINIVDNFNKKHILVIGDLMLDEFLFGKVTRINPEAPVPVLHVEKVIHKLGGAANVASNIVSLGGECTIIGRVGEDNARKIIETEFKKCGINYNMVVDKTIPTIRKVRSIAKNQQLIRADYEVSKKITPEQVKKIISHIKNKKKFDIIIVSDYNKGVVTKELMDELKKFAIRIIADIKPENKEFFKNTYLITPNLKEAQELSGMKGSGDNDVERIGKSIVKEMNANLMITRSENGMSVFEKNGQIHHIPTAAQEVYDVTGAGDTVIAATALSLASDANLEESAIVSNHAAGIVVGRVGTATTNQKELKDIFNKENRKIKTHEEIIKLSEELKLKGKKIVFTNGCFDILHTGHIKVLREAKKQGDVLIVAVNSDYSVKRLKGQERPINNEKDRTEIIASLEQVDYVTLFDEDSPKGLIKHIRPDVFVKGGDYTLTTLNQEERRIVESYGGKIFLVPTVEGKSTTNIINKTQNNRG